MKVIELSHRQLEELKTENNMTLHEVYEEFKNMEFTNNDFWCTCE